MRMDCLMPYTLAGFDLLRQPGPENPGGGVSVKYARCETIPGDLNLRRITTLPEIDADIVWADWLWFRKPYMGQVQESLMERVQQFLELDVKFKGISGTELNIVTWPEESRQMLIENVDCITHVNDFQRSIYDYCGIANSKLLCDPVSEYLFYPAEKKKRLVCMGQIGWHKRSQLVVKLFKALKNTDIETVYIGGSKMWGNGRNSNYNQLHEEIVEAADTFVENATEIEVAYWVNSSMYYAHVAWHDVSPISQRENMMAGNVTFALTHPSMEEVTPYRYENIDELITGIKVYASNPDPRQFQSDAAAAHKFARKHNSYAAWQEQMQAILVTIETY